MFDLIFKVKGGLKDLKFVLKHVPHLVKMVSSESPLVISTTYAYMFRVLWHSLRP